MPLLLLQCIRLCGYTSLYVAVVSHNSRLWWGIPMVKSWIAGSLRIAASWITSQVGVCFGYILLKNGGWETILSFLWRPVFRGYVSFREGICYIFRWIVTTGMQLVLQVITRCYLHQGKVERIPIWLQCGGCLCNLGKRRSCRGGRGVRNYLICISDIFWYEELYI